MADKKEAKKKHKKKKWKLFKADYREAIDRVHIVEDMFFDHVAAHPVVSQSAKYTEIADRIQTDLGKLYQAIGKDH